MEQHVPEENQLSNAKRAIWLWTCSLGPFPSQVQIMCPKLKVVWLWGTSPATGWCGVMHGCSPGVGHQSLTQQLLWDQCQCNGQKTLVELTWLQRRGQGFHQVKETLYIYVSHYCCDCPAHFSLLIGLIQKHTGREGEISYKNFKLEKMLTLFKHFSTFTV